MNESELHQRRIWRFCAICGLIVVAIMLGFGQLPGLAACGESDAILRFEFARDAADVRTQIATPACALGQYYGLWWDAVLFIPAYSAFLILALLGLKSRNPPIARVGVASVAIAALCDQFEGVQLFAILANLPGKPAMFDQLFWAVRIKFALLAVVTFLIAALLVKRGRWHWPAAALVAAGSVATWVGLWLTRPETVSFGGTLSWLPIIITAQFIAWQRMPGPSSNGVDIT